jgi:hypothetical protein
MLYQTYHFAAECSAKTNEANLIYKRSLERIKDQENWKKLQYQHLAMVKVGRNATTGGTFRFEEVPSLLCIPRTFSDHKVCCFERFKSNNHTVLLRNPFSDTSRRVDSKVNTG